MTPECLPIYFPTRFHPTAGPCVVDWLDSGEPRENLGMGVKRIRLGRYLLLQVRRWWIAMQEAVHVTTKLLAWNGGRRGRVCPI